jgi:hypothetical protein
LPKTQKSSIAIKFSKMMLLFFSALWAVGAVGKRSTPDPAPDKANIWQANIQMRVTLLTDQLIRVQIAGKAGSKI